MRRSSSYQVVKRRSSHFDQNVKNKKIFAVWFFSKSSLTFGIPGIFGFIFTLTFCCDANVILWNPARGELAWILHSASLDLLKALLFRQQLWPKVCKVHLGISGKICSVAPHWKIPQWADGVGRSGKPSAWKHEPRQDSWSWRWWASWWEWLSQVLSGRQHTGGTSPFPRCPLLRQLSPIHDPKMMLFEGVRRPTTTFFASGDGPEHAKVHITMCLLPSDLQRFLAELLEVAKANL